ncbi:MAG: hypothetical protein EBZ74_12505 [Planctomycetia bacterium]|nr:hypothetical protein [Planctomycetia bacterium]
MTGKNFLRLFGALVCLTAVVTGFDAEAGWRHRRCCSDSCCSTYTPCCAPVCETACCTTVASCCAPVSYTVVREAVILPSACCASTTTKQETTTAATAEQPEVKLAAAKR